MPESTTDLNPSGATQPYLLAGLAKASISLTNLHAPPPMPPSADHDYYARLRIPKSSNSLDIQDAFRRLVLELHPDRNPSNTMTVFHQLCEAYEVLSNPLTRGVYDLFGKEGLDMGLPPQEGQLEFKGYVYHGDPYLTFKNFFGSDNVFHEIFKSRLYSMDSGTQTMGFSSLKPSPMVSPPIHVPLNVTLAELVYGTVKKIPWTRQVLASKQSDTLTSSTQHLRLILEPGTLPGTQLVFPQLGNESMNSIPSDLIFTVQLQPHAHFELHQQQLIYKKRIRLEEALTGMILHIQTLDQRTLAIPVPEIIYPGYIKQVPNEGFPKLNPDGSKSKGDLLIQFEITFPKYLSLKQKELIQKGLSMNSSSLHPDLKSNVSHSKPGLST